MAAEASLLWFAAATLKKAEGKLRETADEKQGHISKREVIAEVARDYLRLN